MEGRWDRRGDDVGEVSVRWMRLQYLVYLLVEIF